MTEPTRTLATLELVGGVLCLDFVNTVNARPDAEHDYLAHYPDLVDWAGKLGILSPTQAKGLKSRSTQDAQEAERALLSAQSLRDTLYRLFSSSAGGAEPGKKDLEAFTSFYGEAISRSRLRREEDHFAASWSVDESLDSLLWPVVHSAGGLLLSNDLSRVKECPGCGWLFLDTSKNQSRRWCSMNTCGARDKMRRYHKRQRVK